MRNKSFQTWLKDVHFKETPSKLVKDWPVEDGEEVSEIEVDVEVEYQSEDASFDHAFGRQKQTQRSVKEITVYFGDQDVTEFLNTAGLEALEREADEKMD